VTTAKGLREGADMVVSVAADQSGPANEGKLIHMTTVANTGETLADAQFGVSVNALRLHRAALMYQWKQEEESTHSRKIGGSEETRTTYKYVRDWSPDLLRSDEFKVAEGHVNPGAMRFAGETLNSQAVTVGAFKLTDDLVSSIHQFEKLAVAPEDLAASRNRFAKN